MVGNARENMAQIRVGIEAVEFGGRNQHEDRGGSPTISVRAEMQDVFCD